MLVLYDLVAHQNPPGSGSYFSPATIKARLALLHKGIEFRTQDVRYNDLRFTWKDKLGVEKATAPFIQREDGSLLMDSVEIAKWLEETYPDRPSIFQPDQALPIDSNSDTHAQAIKDCVEWPLSPLGYGPMFTWFAPRFAPNFTEEDRTYWTSEARMGPGRFKAMCDADGDEQLAKLKQGIAHLEGLLSVKPDQQFLTSATEPGWKDFAALAVHRMIRCVDSQLADQLWGSGHVGAWRKRMEEKYAHGSGAAKDEGLEAVYARDPK